MILVDETRWEKYQFFLQKTDILNLDEKLSWITWALLRTTLLKEIISKVLKEASPLQSACIDMCRLMTNVAR